MKYTIKDKRLISEVLIQARFMFAPLILGLMIWILFTANASKSQSILVLGLVVLAVLLRSGYNIVKSYRYIDEDYIEVSNKSLILSNSGAIAKIPITEIEKITTVNLFGNKLLIVGHAEGDFDINYGAYIDGLDTELAKTLGEGKLKHGSVLDIIKYTFTRR